MCLNVAEPTQRVKLGKIPFSKSCEFGKTDVEELIWMLEVVLLADCDRNKVINYHVTIIIIIGL